MKLNLSTRIGSIILLALGSAAAQPVAPAAPPAAQPAPAPAPTPAPAAAAAPAPVIIEQAPAPAPAPVVLTPGPVVVVPPVPEAPEEKPKAPKALEVGSGGGDWKPGGLLQLWLYGSHQDMTPEGGTAPVADEDTLTFRLRRAEIRVKGDIVPKRVAFSIMIDPARALEMSNRTVSVSGGGGGSVSVAQPAGGNGPLTILQDIAITFPTDYVDISIGQFKIPLSYEGYNSSSRILFPERAPVARGLGDRRDIGLKFEKKIGEYFGYYAGIFNGAGQNTLDGDTEKDAALRLELYPYEGITVAGVGYTTVGKRKKSSRDRVEADLRYEAHNISFLAEYIHAWTTTRNGPAVEAGGIYAQAAYTFFDHLQPMVRVGSYEPNMDAPNDHFRHYDFGVNWLFQKHEAKLGLSVSVYAPTDENPPSNPKRTEGILAAQASF